MLPYILISLLAAICCYANLIDLGEDLENAIFVTLIIVLTLFLGTRTVGPDLWTYESMYLVTPAFPSLIHKFPIYTAITRFEPLFLSLYGLFKWAGISFRVFNLLFTSTFMYFFFSRLSLYTRYRFVAVMAFLAYGYIAGFSAIRQVMAGSIFFYSIKYLIEGRIKKYCFAIIIACLFHSSAFILLIFAFINKKKFNTNFIILSVIISVAGIYTNAFSAVAGIVLTKIPFLSAVKVKEYLSGKGAFFGSVSITWMLLLAGLLIWREKLEKLDANFNIYLNVFWIGLVVFAVATGFGEFGRVLMYFKFIYLIILPLYVQLIKETAGKIVVCSIIILLSSSLFFASILLDSMYSVENRYLPYNSWLINEK